MNKILAELRSYNNWLVTKATNIRNRHFRTRRRRVLLVVPVLIVTCLVLCLATGVFSKPRDNTPWPSRPLTDRYGSIFDTPMISGMQNFTQLSYNLPFEPEWRREPHLIVYGVLATDKPERRVIRNLQRSTWVRYPDVATRKNAFKGLMLVLYVISPHASISPNITLDMTEEYRRYRDVLLLRMKEELPDQVKVVGKNGGYGMPLQVSNARKRLLFLLYGHYAFPTTPFFGKGDDDAYVYVPEFMRMLRQLPRLNIIYGSVTRGHHQDYHMALGYTYVISRDILPDVMKDDVLNYFLNRPFNVEHWGIYEDIAFHHEDWTIGRSMYRRYMTTTMGPPRVVPAEPPFDKRLPPVEGWGKQYMAYVRDPQNVPHTGRAVSNDGRYNFTYAFPPPDEFLPGNVLWVDDRCRIANQRWPPNATSKDKMRLVVAHRPTTEEQFQAYWKFHEDLGDDEQMMRPVEVNMTSPKHYYYLAEIRFPNGPGECKVNYWV